jgi:hypothetical protein
LGLADTDIDAPSINEQRTPGRPATAQFWFYFIYASTIDIDEPADEEAVVPPRTLAGAQLGGIRVRKRTRRRQQRGVGC